MNPEQQFDILQHFISDERKAAFERVLDNRTRHVTVVLENLFQPHNFSAVLRSCDCFGIQDVHVIENNNAFELKKKIARGSFKWVNIQRHAQKETNTKACLDQLRQKGYSIVATTPRPNGKTPENIDLLKPIALVMGTEWKGISAEAIELADQHLHIPMFGFTESFNVSVATALILNRLTERMRHEVDQWQLSTEEKNTLRAQWAAQSVKGSAQILERSLL